MDDLGVPLFSETPILNSEVILQVLSCDLLTCVTGKKIGAGQLLQKKHYDIDVSYAGCLGGF